jgi:hypothetical protein
MKRGAMTKMQKTIKRIVNMKQYLKTKEKRGKGYS